MDLQNLKAFPFYDYYISTWLTSTYLIRPGIANGVCPSLIHAVGKL